MFSFSHSAPVKSPFVDNLMNKLEITAIDKSVKDHKLGQEFILNALGASNSKDKKLFKVLHMAMSLISNNYDLSYKLKFNKKPSLIDFYCLYLILNDNIKYKHPIVKKLKSIKRELLFVYSHANAVFELKEIPNSKKETLTQIQDMSHFFSGISEIDYKQDKSIENQIAREIFYFLSEQLTDSNENSDPMLYMLFENILLKKKIIGIPHSYKYGSKDEENNKSKTYVFMEQLFYEENRKKDQVWLAYESAKKGFFSQPTYLSNDLLIYLPCFLNFDNCNTTMQERVSKVIEKVKRSEIGKFYQRQGAEINDNFMVISERSKLNQNLSTLSSSVNTAPKL